MTLRRKLSSDVQEWNNPRRAQFGIPVAAGVGFLVGILLGAMYVPGGLSGVVLASVCAGSGHLLGLVLAAVLD